jgi:HAD superfamily hydrolase (TIGR01549 family)
MTLVLFDLDNTLLDSDMRVFLPPYFEALGKRMSKFIEPKTLTEELMASTHAMIDNADPVVTNQEAFDQAFQERLGDLAEVLRPEFDEFYERDFPKLRYLTNLRPEARPLVEYLIASGHQIAVATNPLFPRRAVEQRLNWAGLEGIPFALITTYENSHFCKPNPRYLEEILAKLEHQPCESLMVGDSLENDIQPAREIGIPTYWIHNGSPDAEYDGPQGTLSEFAVLVMRGGLGALLHDRE